jgi:hypothetical protein
VQVPQHVAEEWAALCADGVPGKKLGRVDKRARTLELSGDACKRGNIERTYEVQPPRSQQVPMLVFARNGERTGA